MCSWTVCFFFYIYLSFTWIEMCKMMEDGIWKWHEDAVRAENEILHIWDCVCMREWTTQNPFPTISSSYNSRVLKFAWFLNFHLLAFNEKQDDKIKTKTTIPQLHRSCSFLSSSSRKKRPELCHMTFEISSWHLEHCSVY